MKSCETNVVYGMYSGLALLMDVYLPETSNGSGVVYISGSAWHLPMAYNSPQLKDTPLGLPWIEAMRAAGYAVFAINHRAAPRFKYPGAIEDAQRAVRYVRHHAVRFGIDPIRIGACGGSSGGHIVSLLGTLQSEGDTNDPDPVNRESAAVRCVVARAPIVDFTAMGRGGVIADFMGMAPRGEAAGDYAFEHNAYRQASPTTHVSSSTAPFLLVHGTADKTVPFAQSELMQAALRAAGVHSELLPVPGGAHGPNFPGSDSPPDYLGATVAWLDRYLRND